MPALVVFFMLIIGVFMLSSCEQFGANPSGAYLSDIEASPNYDAQEAQFVNEETNVVSGIGDDINFWDDPFGRDTPNFLFNSNQTSPNTLMPEVQNTDMLDFLNSESTVKFIWLGHSSILLSIDGKTVLIDPVFSKNAAPVSFMIKRFQPPVITLDKMPKVDYILISHDHYDHLDMETVKYFNEKQTTFILPLGVGSHLRRWGIDQSKIIELDWWSNVDLGDLSFTGTPAKHFSGRLGLLSPMKTLWSSWVIKSSANSIYFSGDSGYDTHYKKIGDRLGPFDVIFMDSGQYNERWRAMHNMPHEVIKGFKDLGGRYLVPVHWGMFNISLHNWFDPPAEVTVRSRDNEIQLITPRLGEIVSLENPPLFDEWWTTVD